METGERTKRRRGISCATYLQNLRINCPRPNRDQGKDPKSCVFIFFFLISFFFLSFMCILQLLTVHFFYSVYLCCNHSQHISPPLFTFIHQQRNSKPYLWYLSRCPQLAPDTSAPLPPHSTPLQSQVLNINIKSSINSVYALIATTSITQNSTAITGHEHQHKIIRK